MQYSFQILDRALGNRKTLYCKLDCSIDEYTLLRCSQMLQAPIYERDHNQELAARLLKGAAQVIFSSPSRAKDKQLKERLQQKYRKAYVLDDFISGVGIPLTPYEVPLAEGAIEMRLFEIATTVQLAIKRLEERGRSYDL